jgi:methylated-DNA-[protein]-cysteine S-methyltransferase
MTEHSFAMFDTAIGRCGIAWGPRGINAVQLPMSNEDKTRARIRQRYGDIAEAPPPAEVQNAIDGIAELLAGKPNDLSDVVLDLDGVPEFHRGVYDIARTIPPGKTMT